MDDIFVNPPKLISYDFQSAQLHIDNNSKSEQIETVLKKKDESTINVLLIASPISFLNNNGVVFSLRDISTNKKIADDLNDNKG